ncbi:hypothetical protein SLA2020_406420 [Shorea laevis]
MHSLRRNPTQAQLKSIITEEKLTVPFDFPHFLVLMVKHMKPEPFDCQLCDAFKVLDKESTEFVSVADLRHILTSIGEKLESFEFDEWIREVDVESDGKIRYENFIARMVAKCLVTIGCVCLVVLERSVKIKKLHTQIHHVSQTEDETTIIPSFLI